MSSKAFNKLSIKNQRSKKHTQDYRKYFSLNRNLAGFSIENKDLTYTLVCDKSEGAYVEDIDNNKYIDLTMGFGSILFGHNYPPIRIAIEKQLKKAWSVGPITPLAGELSRKISEMTGVERVAFFNSGTEAIMVALRVAKAITQKKNIVFFKGSYHGTFDSLLSLKNDPKSNLALEIIPGVTQSILNESYLLEYGSEASLDFIGKNKDNIAAVLAEPVQSRNPSLQPAEYLKQLRELTSKHDIALVFDEVITGFRIGCGGCQEYFGIQADLVTYGKVIGGGLPIGIVAGKAQYLDALDGGYWNFEDNSIPKIKPTFVAGTFCHHPLAMSAALEVIHILQSSEGKILTDLNLRTEAFCRRMNQYFESEGFRFSIDHFSSLFRINTPGKSKNIYYQLLLEGVYVWEGRNCFLSAAHDEKVVELLEEKIIYSCEQLVKKGIIKQIVSA